MKKSEIRAAIRENIKAQKNIGSLEIIHKVSLVVNNIWNSSEKATEKDYYLYLIIYKLLNCDNVNTLKFIQSFTKTIIGNCY